jgi:23S rRNA G2445 N2-methylase RlmL
MCGSGTIPIEAALLATNTAPGLLRYSSSEKPKPGYWKDISVTAWDKVHKEAQQLDQRKSKLAQYTHILANDMHPGAIKLASESAINAGVSHLIQFSCSDILDYRPPRAIDLTISNPPWNIRLEGADQAWNALRLFSLANNIPQQHLWAVTGDGSLLGYMKRKPSHEIRFQAANTNLVYAQF